MGNLRLTSGLRVVRSLSFSLSYQFWFYALTSKRVPPTKLDIIATLVIGVCLIGVFVYWQWFLEKAQNERLKLLEQEEEKTTTTPAADNGESPPTTLPFKKKLNKRLPPPLMKLSLWKRANGRFAVMMVIACLTWCSFFGWMFWVQVRCCSISVAMWSRVVVPSTFSLTCVNSCTTRITWVLNPSNLSSDWYLQCSSPASHVMLSWV